MTSTLLRELPVAALVDQASATRGGSEALNAAFLKGAILDVLVRTAVIELRHDESGKITGALLPEKAPDPSPLGIRRAKKVPREPSGGRVGAPAVSRDFLQEIAIVHQIAAKNRLGKTLMRYLEVRVEERVPEKRINRYLAECRDVGMLPRRRSTRDR